MKKAYIKFYNWHLRAKKPWRILSDFFIAFVIGFFWEIVFKNRWDVISSLAFGLVMGIFFQFFYSKRNFEPIAEEEIYIGFNEQLNVLIRAGLSIIIFGCLIYFMDTFFEERSFFDESLWYRLPLLAAGAYLFSYIAEIYGQHKKLIMQRKLRENEENLQ